MSCLWSGLLLGRPEARADFFLSVRGRAESRSRIFKAATAASFWTSKKKSLVLAFGMNLDQFLKINMIQCKKITNKPLVSGAKVGAAWSYLFLSRARAGVWAEAGFGYRTLARPSHLLWIRLQPKCPGYGSTTLYFIEQSPISCLLSPVSHLPSFISCLLSHVSHLPSSVSHLLSPVSHLSSPVSHLPSFVSCIPSTVSHLLCCNCCRFSRAEKSLIRFLSELFVFCPKMSKWAIRSKKWAIHSFSHFWWATWAIRSWSLISSEGPERIAHGRSFLVSDLNKLLMIAHFLWGTCANGSWWLIFGEGSEWIAHSCSFDLSEMREMSKWANERWENERVPSPEI